MAFPIGNVLFHLCFYSYTNLNHLNFLYFCKILRLETLSLLQLLTMAFPFWHLLFQLQTLALFDLAVYFWPPSCSFSISNLAFQLFQFPSPQALRKTSSWNLSSALGKKAKQDPSRRRVSVRSREFSLGVPLLPPKPSKTVLCTDGTAVRNRSKLLSLVTLCKTVMKVFLFWFSSLTATAPEWFLENAWEHVMRNSPQHTWAHSSKISRA